MNSFRPHFPGGLLARPEFIQVLVFAVGIHGIEEPVVAVSHELTFARQPLHRLPFEDAPWALKVIADAAGEDGEPLANQTLPPRFLHEAPHLAPGIRFPNSAALHGRNFDDACATAL